MELPITISQPFGAPFTYRELDNLLQEAGAWQPICVVPGKAISTGKQGSFMGLPDEHGGMPCLRCPSFHGCEIMPDFMHKYLDAIFSCTGVRYNIVKVLKYIQGTEGIAAHSDKCIDLEVDTDILIYRMNSDGNTRSLCFRDKGTGREYTYLMRSNQLMSIPYNTNRSTVHYVPSEECCTPECISFVFRVAHTFQKDGMTYGQGAKYKTYHERLAAGVSANSPDLLELYRYENTNDTSSIHLDNEIYRKIIEQTL